MICLYTDYKIVNNISLALLNLQLTACYTEYKCNGKLKAQKTSYPVSKSLLHAKENVNIEC